MDASLNREHIEIDVNTQLSDMDKAYMVINYPRATANPAAPTWTLDHALTVAGVDAKNAKAIKNANNRNKPDLVRSLFTNYLIQSRQSGSMGRAAGLNTSGQSAMCALVRIHLFLTCELRRLQRLSSRCSILVRRAIC
jgi:hypothetical protein